MARETGPEAEAGRDGLGDHAPGSGAAPGAGSGSDEVSGGAVAGSREGEAGPDPDAAPADLATPVVRTVHPPSPEARSVEADEAAGAVPDLGAGNPDEQAEVVLESGREVAPEESTPWGASGLAGPSSEPAMAPLPGGAGDGPRTGDLGSDREGFHAHAADIAPDNPSDDRPDLGPRAPAPEDMAPLVLPRHVATDDAPGARPSPPAFEPSAPAAPPPRRGGFGALLLGGLIAAALGFGAAWLARDRLLVPDSELDARLAALEARPAPTDPAARLGEVEARLAALEEEVAAVAARPVPEPTAEPTAEPTPEPTPEPAPPSAPPPDLAPLRQDLAAASEAAEAALARAEALDRRIAALEARPVVAGPAVEAPPASAPEAPLGSLAADPDALRNEVLAAVEPRLATLEERQSAVEPRLLTLEERQAAVDPRLTTLEERQAAVDPRLTTLEERQADVEPRLATLEEGQTSLAGRLDATATTALTAEAEAASARDQAARAAQALATAQGEAQAAERRADAEAALTSLAAALEAGEPLGPALSELEAAGTAAPPALAALAETGAPTLAALREAFPEAARDALAAAREAGLTDEGRGVGAFLRRQLSLRSTEPREGADPDAVLARAEAALGQGRLSLALQELGGLPEPARAAMAGWIADAQARANADAALAGLRGGPAGPAVEPAVGPAVEPTAQPAAEPAVEPAAQPAD